MEQKLDVGLILGRMWQVVSLSRGQALLFVAVFFALGVLQSRFPDSVGLILAAGVFGFAANYLLLRSLLQNAGLKRAGEGGGFGAYFAVGFLAGLGGFLGFILFVIPGIVLMVRWLPADAMILSEGKAASDTLGESWDMTGEHFWPLLAVALLGWVPYLAVVFGAGVGADLYNLELKGTGYEIGLLAADALGAVYPVYSLSLSVATYWLLRGDRRTIEEVFA